MSFAITLLLMAGMLVGCLAVLLGGKQRHTHNYNYIVLIACVVAIVLYGLVGSPNLPDFPFASRAEFVLAQQRTQAQQQREAQARFADAKDLLADQPNDPNVLLALAEAAAAVGDYDTERAALEKRLAITDDSNTRALLAEAITRQAGGIVTEAAFGLLTEALAENAGDWRAAYLLGLHAQQNGQLVAAAAIWQELGKLVAASGAEGEAMLALVNSKLREVAAALNQPAEEFLIKQE